MSLAAYLALLQLGFAVPLMLPRARWALTPPFHPYLGFPWRSVFCGTFRNWRITPPVPRRYLAALSTEPGLSSI